MIKRNEFDYLIHLLKCALGSDKPNEKPDGVSFENVFECALKHDVANLAFYSVEKLENKPDRELYDRWKQVRDLAVMRDINQQFAHDELVAELKNEGVRSLEIQGTLVKKYYPQSDMRTMSDIDFVIDRENLGKAEEILKKLGYECDCHPYEVDAKRNPNINIEFHSKVFDSHPFIGCYENTFENAESADGFSYVYNINDFYVYNMFHLLKHYCFESGCGIRRFCDIYVLNKALGDKHDREYIKTMYDKFGVTVEALSVENLAQALFGNGEMTEELSAMTDEIMTSAVHGTRTITVKNAMKKMTKNGKKHQKIRYFFSRVFLNYDKMVYQYPSLEGKKALLPIYYVRRVFRIAFKERYKVKRVTDSIKDAQDDMKK